MRRVDPQSHLWLGLLLSVLSQSDDCSRGPDSIWGKSSWKASLKSNFKKRHAPTTFSCNFSKHFDRKLMRIFMRIFVRILFPQLNQAPGPWWMTLQHIQSMLGPLDGLDVDAVLEKRLPDGKIWSLPFLGLRQGGGRGGAIQGKEGIKFCSAA